MENKNTTNKLLLLILVLGIFVIGFLVLAKPGLDNLSDENEIKNGEIYNDVYEEKEEPSGIPKDEKENILPKNETEDKKISCENKGGEWFTESGVCEINSLSEQECLVQGGEFNECASACRHDPEAEFCIQQCVLTCTFR